jgi:proline iminopeptidase
MRNVLVVLLSLVFSVNALATPEEEVRAAELAFSKAFVDRDAARFFAMVAEDAVFNGRGPSLHGRAAIVEGWGPLLKTPKPVMMWGPDRVVVNGNGTIGLSFGPIYDFETARNIGYYSSVWQKQQDGSWKVLFDGPGAPGVTLADDALKVEEGFVTADDGAKLHYRKVGQGRLTLIVPLEFVMFDDFTQFADMATVIAYDLRDRGRSSKVEEVKSLTIQQDVLDLEAVRRHFKVEKFVPVGFSYLGKAVLMYAMQFPQHVSRVVQIAPAEMRNQPAGKREVAKADLGIPPTEEARWNELRASGAQQTSPREFCEAQWNALKYMFLGDPSHAGRFPVKATCELENEWPVNFGRHMQSLGPSLAATNLSDEDVKKVTAPVLIIHGTKDRNASFEGGQAWRNVLPNARLVRVEGAAHLVWADDPVTVFGSIRQFLRGEVPLGSI